MPRSHLALCLIWQVKLNVLYIHQPSHSCLVLGVAKRCTCHMPNECDCWYMYIQLARSGTGQQDVIAGASMWSRSPGRKCDCRWIRPSRLKFGSIVPNPKIFSSFTNYFLRFYKSQFSGTTFVLVEKLLLLVYGLFRNLKNLTFVRVRRHKTLNDAIYMIR